MRTVLMLASVLIVAILIFKGYPGNLSTDPESSAGTNQIDPREKAYEVNQVILDAASNQKRELEKQLQ